MSPKEGPSTSHFSLQRTHSEHFKDDSLETIHLQALRSQYEQDGISKPCVLISRTRDMRSRYFVKRIGGIIEKGKVGFHSTFPYIVLSD